MDPPRGLGGLLHLKGTLRYPYSGTSRDFSGLRAHSGRVQGQFDTGLYGGVSQNRGYHFGGPNNKDLVFWGL